MSNKNKQSDKENEHTQERTNEKTQKDLPLELSEQLGSKSTIDAVLQHYNAWLPKYREFAQGRSNFQIEKMIATEHATPAAAYQHTLYQLRVMHQSLIDDFVRGIEKTREFEYKWEEVPHDKPQKWETEKGGTKLCWYDTDLLRHEHELEELKMSVKDKLLQLETFTKVLSAMEEKHGGRFTAKELNDEEPEYWKLRLARQMSDEYLDRQTGLGTGNIKSLRMGMAESPVAGSNNKIEDFPDLFNAVLSGRENALEVLNEVNEKLFGQMDSLGAAEKKLADLKDKYASIQQPKTNEEASVPTQSPVEKLRQIGIGISELED